MNLRDQAPRFVAEFAVIVTGVLVALAADGWSQERENRALELQYLERVLTELEADSRLARAAQEGFEGKLEALDRLSRWDGAAVDEGFLEDLSRSSAWAWNLPPANSTTFSEMQNTGRLALIRDPDLRAALGSYYREHEDHLGSIDARRTEMGPLTYRLLRRTTQGRGDARGDGRPPVAPDALPEFDVRALLEPQIVTAIRQSALAELNFANFAGRRMARALAAAERLADQIREYLAVTAS